MKKNRFIIFTGLILIIILIFLASYFLQNNRQILNSKAEIPSNGTTCPSGVDSEAVSCENPGEWCIKCLSNTCPEDANYNVESPYRCDDGVWKLQNANGECSNKCGAINSDIVAMEGGYGGGVGRSVGDSNYSEENSDYIENNMSYKQDDPTEDNNECNIDDKLSCELYKADDGRPSSGPCDWYSWKLDGTTCNRCLEAKATNDRLNSVCPPQPKIGFDCGQLSVDVFGTACQTAIDNGYSCVWFPECNRCANLELNGVKQTKNHVCYGYGGSVRSEKKEVKFGVSVNLINCPNNYVIKNIGYSAYDEYNKMTVAEQNGPYNIPGVSSGRIIFPVSLEIYYSGIKYTFSGNTIVSDGTNNYYSHTPIKQSVSTDELKTLDYIPAQIDYKCSKSK